MNAFFASNIGIEISLLAQILAQKLVSASVCNGVSFKRKSIACDA